MRVEDVRQLVTENERHFRRAEVVDYTAANDDRNGLVGRVNHVGVVAVPAQIEVHIEVEPELVAARLQRSRQLLRERNERNTALDGLAVGELGMLTLEVRLLHRREDFVVTKEPVHEVDVRLQRRLLEIDLA